MPGTARLDAPSVLHHVMIPGIEGKEIFRNNKDRDDFIERLETLCPEMKITCYACTFISNHATSFSATEYILGYFGKNKKDANLN